MKKNLRSCAKVLKSLSEDIRLQIIKCLFKGEYSVSQISKLIGREHSQVSHHLGILRNSGIVIDRREGKYIMYRIDPSLQKNFKNKNSLDFKCCTIGFNKNGSMEINSN